MTRLSPAWSKAVDEWLGWLKAGRPSPLTIRQRRWQLGVLAQAFADRSPWDITPDELAAWLGEQDQWVAETARAQRAAVRSFYGWALDSGRIDRDPAARLPKIQRAAGLPRPAGDDAVARALDNGTDKIRLMASCALYAGLRCAEIAALRWQDIESGAIIVSGKGRKLRRVPLHPKLASLLTAEQTRRADAGHGTGWRYASDGDVWVFPGQSGGPMAARWVSQTLSVALGPGVTAHMLRHRFLTRAYQGTKDLQAVQQLAGHSSPATTAGYTLIGADALEQAVLAAGE